MSSKPFLPSQSPAANTHTNKPNYKPRSNAEPEAKKGKSPCARNRECSQSQHREQSAENLLYGDLANCQGARVLMPAYGGPELSYSQESESQQVSRTGKSRASLGEPQGNTGRKSPYEKMSP